MEDSKLFPIGKDVYDVDAAPVVAKGVSLSTQELEQALEARVCGLLWDDAGHEELDELLSSVTTTAFEEDRLREVLSQEFEPEDWRVGEALAEAYLVDHKDCQFPWPGGRDLKNPSASAAGTDLVGFQAMGTGYRFAFGEVKTSWQEQWPPSVVTSRHGLSNQIEALRDDTSLKHSLLRYLGWHANGKDWKPAFLSAAQRYLSDPSDVSLFGILVRDVEVKDLDLRSRAKALAASCPASTSIDLRAFYLPAGVIPSLPAMAAKARGV